jgi:hypothetical protein
MEGSIPLLLDDVEGEEAGLCKHFQAADVKACSLFDYDLSAPVSTSCQPRAVCILTFASKVVGVCQE